MLVASLGTPFEIQTEGTILFIEDVAEKPFRIDRMLMQLRLAGKLESVRGFVFGEMLDCLPPKGETYTLQQVVMRVLAPYNVPIVYGLKSGHVTKVTYHIAHRRAGGAGGGSFRSITENCGSGNGFNLTIQNLTSARGV